MASRLTDFLATVTNLSRIAPDNDAGLGPQLKRTRELPLPPPGGPYRANFLEWAWAPDESQCAILMRLWHYPPGDRLGPSGDFELTWLISFTNDAARQAVEDMIALKTHALPLDDHTPAETIHFWFGRDDQNPSGLVIERSEWVMV